MRHNSHTGYESEEKQFLSREGEKRISIALSKEKNMKGPSRNRVRKSRYTERKHETLKKPQSKKIQRRYQAIEELSKMSEKKEKYIPSDIFTSRESYRFRVFKKDKIQNLTDRGTLVHIETIIPTRRVRVPREYPERRSSILRQIK